MAIDPSKGHRALRRGRSSSGGATYFVTICTRDRLGDLSGADLLRVLTDEFRDLTRDRSWKPRAWVVMPDHLHFLFVLGERLSLSQLVGRLKARTKADLEEQGIAWQRGYYDHRINPDEGVFPIFAYLYRNPARAGLPEPYLGWWISEEDAVWFYPELELASLDEIEVPKWVS